MKQNREIRSVPPGWQHPTIDDPTFPSPYWRNPEEILHSEVVNEGYVKKETGMDELEQRRERYMACRESVGLGDGQAFRPMIDYTLEDAQAEWDGYWQQWQEGTYPGQGDQERTLETFEVWHGVRPAERHHLSTFRPDFDDDPTCWQMYETITEGTPVSPVFDNLNDLFRWMMFDGGLDGAYTEDEALELLTPSVIDA